MITDSITFKRKIKGKAEHILRSWYPRVKDNKVSRDGDNRCVDEFWFYYDLFYWWLHIVARKVLTNQKLQKSLL